MRLYAAPRTGSMLLAKSFLILHQACKTFAEDDLEADH
jgi:hypothetical protein